MKLLASSKRLTEGSVHAGEKPSVASLKIDARHAARLRSRVKVERKVTLNGIIFLSSSVVLYFIGYRFRPAFRGPIISPSENQVETFCPVIVAP